MIIKEDNTYNEIRAKSLDQWLDEMSKHEDIAVRGGVKLTREYTKSLKDEIRRLEEACHFVVKLEQIRQYSELLLYLGCGLRYSLCKAVPPRNARFSLRKSSLNILTRARQMTRSCSTIASVVHGATSRHS